MDLRVAQSADAWFIEALDQGSSESSLNRNLISRLIEREQIFLISDNNDLSGFLVEQVVLDEAELIQIIIRPDKQRLGLARGSLILWHADLKRRQVSKVFLEVRDGNDAALHLYQKLGYQINGSRKNYYSKGAEKFDAMLMGLGLF